MDRPSSPGELHTAVLPLDVGIRVPHTALSKPWRRYGSPLLSSSHTAFLDFFLETSHWPMPCWTSSEGKGHLGKGEDSGQEALNAQIQYAHCVHCVKSDGDSGLMLSPRPCVGWKWRVQALLTTAFSALTTPYPLLIQFPSLPFLLPGLKQDWPFLANT